MVLKFRCYFVLFIEYMSVWPTSDDHLIESTHDTTFKCIVLKFPASGFAERLVDSPMMLWDIASVLCERFNACSSSSGSQPVVAIPER